MSEVNQEAQQEIQLGVQDLAAAVQIIDICSKRGAFEGAELEQVGAVRSRFVAFLQANAEQEEQAETEEVTEEAAE